MFTILIADNSLDVLEVMKILLEMDGHEIKTAQNKEILLKQLRLSVPDLIIIDTFLDGRKGKEICKEVKNNEVAKNIPIILMSTNEKILSDYEECGAIDILPKPFQNTELKKKIKDAIALVKAKNG